jgi:putative acetyltransferase
MMIIRPETPADASGIHSLIRKAFLDAEHASGTEAEIVDRLRADKALTVSLVAVDGGELVGQVAFSPVTIGGRTGWYGLGPVAVRSESRRQGIAEKLIVEGLSALKMQGAGGCVVLGDPAYYGRFGFSCDTAVTLAGIPPEYFQLLRLGGPKLTGPVAYHRAFGID